MVNEVEAENANAEPGKEFVFTIESVISDVTLSQDGCDERENGLVMMDSGASVNVCPKWFGNPKWNSLTVQLVSEVPTENRCKSTESDRSG